MNNGHQSGVAGTQTVHRAIDVLCAIAANPRRGATLKDLVHTTGLNRSTAFRMVQALFERGILNYNEDTKTYFVGHLAYEIGLSAGTHNYLASDWWECITNIRNITGMTTYLGVISGMDIVCIAGLEGAGQVRAVPYEVGERHPIGVGSGSLAILANMDDQEVAGILDRTLRQGKIFRRVSITREELLRRIEITRKKGYGCSKDTFVPGVVGIAVEVRSRSLLARLAISISIPSTDVSPAEEAHLVGLMRSAISEEMTKLTR